MGGLAKSYGHSKPFATWDVLLQDHHEGYIDWDDAAVMASASRRSRWV